MSQVTQQVGTHTSLEIPHAINPLTESSPQPPAESTHLSDEKTEP